VTSASLVDILRFYGDSLPITIKVTFCFLAGTMSTEVDSQGQFIPEVGSLFSFSKDWKPTKHVTKITVSNGLAWSEDLKLMYYIDSPTSKVDAFDFDAENVKLCKYSCTGV
jgi:sugar lactone lactonase YvrE